MRRRIAKRGSCPTLKARYPDHQSAAAAVSLFRTQSTRDRVPARAYRCPLCQGWHLTAMTEEEYGQGRSR